MSAPMTLGFLGTGRMAVALARGCLRGGMIEVSHLIGSDCSEAARANFVRETGGRAAACNRDLVEAANVVVVAVKPPQVGEVLRQVSGQMSQRHLVVSIAAGITLARLRDVLPAEVRLVRAMPNTPALVGASATAYAADGSATDDDRRVVEALFASVGLAMEVSEDLLDAVTGLSGSGPAYGYRMIEALSDGGVAAGLPRDTAIRLAAQTLLGAARMVLETGLHPAVLKDQVTSPGGTTIEGLHELEKAAVPAALISAVRAAARRARELAEG